MIAAPAIVAANQLRAMALGYLVFSGLYLGSGAFHVGPPRLLQPRRPRVELVIVETLDDEVVAAVAPKPADLKGRLHVGERTETGHAPQWAAQLLGNLLGL